MSDSLKEFLTGLARCGKYLPAGEQFPIEVVVLRGHLLIEEELKLLVRSAFVQPKAYDIQSATFMTAFRLARALHGEKLDEWEWNAIHEVNTMRNSLAHQLEDEMLEGRIQRFFETFAQKDSTSRHADADTVYRMQYCLSALHATLARVRTDAL